MDRPELETDLKIFQVFYVVALLGLLWWVLA